MGDVLPGSRERVVLTETPQRTERAIQNPSQWASWERFQIDREKVDQIVKAALFDCQRPVHEGFAEVEARPGDELPVERSMVKPDRDALSGGSGEAVNATAGIHNAEPADRDNLLEQTRQQHCRETA